VALRPAPELARPSPGTLHHREETLSQPGPNSVMSPSNASAGRMRPTTHRPQAYGSHSVAGLPTNATAAVMLNPFGVVRIPPGPTLFEKEPLLIWNADRQPVHRQTSLLLGLNLPLAPLWPSCLRTPRPICTAGTCSSPHWARAVNVQALDLARLLVFGCLRSDDAALRLPVLPC